MRTINNKRKGYKNMKTENKNKISFTVSENLKKEIKKLKKEYNANYSDIYRMLIIKGLEASKTNK